MLFPKLETYAISDIGLVRPNNEDVVELLPNYHFFTIADGMGGPNAGEVAAKETIQSICSSIQKQKKILSKQELVRELKVAIKAANSKIYALSQENCNLRGMGTTLCCLKFHKENIIYAHVGDSRIYRFRGNLIKQLTKDHASSKEGSSKRLLTKAIGILPKIEPSLRSSTFKKEDIYLMCTDGLTDYVSDEEIAFIIKNNSSLKTIVENLILSAKNYYSHDNISILMVRVC